jgi:hypothetical protein
MLSAGPLPSTMTGSGRGILTSSWAETVLSSALQARAYTLILEGESMWDLGVVRMSRVSAGGGECVPPVPGSNEAADAVKKPEKTAPATITIGLVSRSRRSGSSLQMGRRRRS